jgi:Predicted membrane protein
METWSKFLPVGFTDFILVLTFSLLIGLSQRRLNLHKEATFFGSDRTFTLIGLLGYILYLFSPKDFMLFAGGGFLLTILLGINYYFKVHKLGSFGITSIITALLTYCIGPLVTLTSSWFYVSVVVVVLLLTEMKSTFVELAQKMNNDEFITLAKFLIISFIILPMLPDTRIIPEISLTPYRIWLATVIISGISYLSYIVKKYIFPKSGVVVSGFLGGLYSSTATITILARKCKNAQTEHLPEYITAMFLAIGMMFLRLMIIIAIFNFDVFKLLVIPMAILMTVSCCVGIYTRKGNQANRDLPEDEEETDDNNPLEFKVALIFAFLFVVFTLLTFYTMEYMGSAGLTILSFISGIGDITPFILNLTEGQLEGVTLSLMAACCLQATLSNNIIKMFYAMGFSGNRKEIAKPLFTGFAIISVTNLIVMFFFL